MSKRENTNDLFFNDMFRQFEEMDYVMSQRGLSKDQLDALFWSPTFLLILDSSGHNFKKIFLDATDKDIKEWVKEGYAKQKKKKKKRWFFF